MGNLNAVSYVESSGSNPDTPIKDKDKYMQEEECPFCNYEFDIKAWHDGKCPGCKEEYTGDSIGSDWVFPVWENRKYDFSQ